MGEGKVEWSKRGKACSIRLKPKFKEKIYFYISSERKNWQLTTTIKYMHVLNNMVLTAEKSAPQRYQQPMS